MSMTEQRPKWVVILVTEPKQNDFRDGYFPRKFRYKKDALELIAEVRRKGGAAMLQKHYPDGAYEQFTGPDAWSFVDKDSMQ